MNEQFSYRRIVKATGIFGGVQMVGILCSLIKTKFIALWLGAEGVGILGLYNTSVEMITALTGLGLRNSAVRDVSRATEGSDERKLAETKAIVRRWSWFVGLAGAVLTLSFAPLLSRWTFGDDRHIWGVVILSCTLLLNALTSGEQAVLQGTRLLRILAKSGVVGAVSGLFVSLPLYYFFGLSGIVPSLVATALTTLLSIYLFTSKIPEKKIDLTHREVFHRGFAMAKLGTFMTVSGFVTTLFSYIFIAYLNRRDGMADVGYYQAGFGLIGKYIGLVFTAMSADYYPRLAAIQDNPEKTKVLVNQQAETSMLILLPIVCLFLLFQPLIIRLLFSADFLIIQQYTSWAILGVLFKAASWSVGFILLARGAGLLFLITELLSAALTLVLNILFYGWLGLEGLGMAYVMIFALHLVLLLILTSRYYAFRYSARFLILFLVSLITCTLVFLTNYIPQTGYRYGLAVLFSIFALLYSGRQLYIRLNSQSKK